MMPPMACRLRSALRLKKQSSVDMLFGKSIILDIGLFSRARERAKGRKKRERLFKKRIL